jgi:hypothetical protein
LAAAVIEIICSVLAALCAGFAFLMFLVIPLPTGSPQLPSGVKPMMEAMMLLFLALAILGIFTGIGLIRLKGWARIITLVWAGISAIFSSFILLFAMFMPFSTVPNQPAESVPLARLVLAFFYGIPFVIAVWWLILFTRTAIVSQFSTSNASIPPGLAVLPGESFPFTAPALAAKPSCPLPLAVVAGFFIFSSFSLAFLVFSHMPAVILGRAIHGPSGTGIWVLSCALYLIAGIGLLLLKPWSHALAMGIQFFWLLSGTISMLSSNYEKVLRETLASMSMTSGQTYTADYFRYIRSFSLIGLMFPVAILGVLIYYRPRFLESASRVSSKL